MDFQSFYEQMFLIRTTENKLLELFSQGKIKGTIHTSIGQEACAVGTINAIDKERDIVFSNHRAHGHIIAYGVPIKQLIAEILGKASGLCRGVGGSQHLYWKNFYTHGIQGSLVPIAVGAAFAEKIKKSEAIALVFLGDGTMGQGVVYESFNLASKWKVPLLFILENNKYAQTTRFTAVHAGNLENRSQPFDIPSIIADGNNIEDVYAKTFEITKIIRKENIPYFLILDTYRLGPHSKGDDIRPKEELAFHWKNEPLLRIIDKIELTIRQQIEQKVTNELDEIINELIDEPYLSFEEFSNRRGNV